MLSAVSLLSAQDWSVIDFEHVEQECNEDHHKSHPASTCAHILMCLMRSHCHALSAQQKQVEPEVNVARIKLGANAQSGLQQVYSTRMIVQINCVVLKQHSIQPYQLRLGVQTYALSICYTAQTPA